MIKITDPKILRIVDETVRKNGVVGDYEVNVYEVDEEEIKQLHHKWMKVQGYEEELHDVLSFPLDKDTTYPDGVTRLGDIVICKIYAEKQKETIEELVEHGTLHLLGIHHE
jgi:ssRNA-specific RNase YbeY (16S rRNA maturation enzyme)